MVMTANRYAAVALWPTNASDSSLLGHQEDDDDMGDLAKSDNAELVRAKARAQVRYAVAT